MGLNKCNVIECNGDRCLLLDVCLAKSLLRNSLKGLSWTLCLSEQKKKLIDNMQEASQILSQKVREIHEVLG